MRTSILLSLLLLVVFVGQVQAQDRLEDEPGYYDLSGLEYWFDTEPRLEVNVKGALLRLVAEASRFEDPELANLLLKLKAIQVRGYETRRSQFREISAQTAEIGKKLENRGWDTLVRVREDDERVDMYVKVHDDIIAGMVVMVVEPGDDGTIFLNIVGEIDPEQIGRIGRKFNLGHIEEW